MSKLRHDSGDRRLVWRAVAVTTSGKEPRRTAGVTPGVVAPRDPTPRLRDLLRKK